MKTKGLDRPIPKMKGMLYKGNKMERYQIAIDSFY